MVRMFRYFALAIVSSSLLHASTLDTELQDLPRQAHQMVVRLQQWYDPDTGLWKSTGWWNSANALAILVDYSRVASTQEFTSVLERSFAQHLHPGFLNEFYDDEGWWALAWIDAYDLTQKPEYLEMAGSIFNDMSGGWDDVCGGGIWWSKERGYKNAIANELFLSVAAHLANRAHSKEEKARYRTWANREWAWFRNSTMIREDNQINDGLDKNCKNNHKTIWTYNQGVILGALTELSKLHDKTHVLQRANDIADAAIENLTDSQGVLRDACEPNCGGDDVPQFKGIFVRNLSALQHTSPHRQYADFIEVNARAIVAHQDAEASIGIDWNKPTTTASAATQSSGLDAVVSALSLQQQH
jgi:predicted alpha-1,6-mannanase (GH76 family)